MVFGDPNNFAILMEPVSAWSEDAGYNNGLFHFIINGKLFPDNASVATLDGDISCLSEDSALVTIVEDKALFTADKHTAFTTMLNKMLPELLNPDADVPDDFVTDYRYQASTYNLENNMCYAFAVGHNMELRILAAKTSYLSGNDHDGYQWENLDNLDVQETILPHNEIEGIIASTREFYKHIS
ncbi:immunity 42 family protein [Erwinia sp. V71]|uniref:immunity 42 family protein n=1 Tax=Erwinia sp. V71 TaxID=3369424 RepID=UPI003F6201DC